MKTELNFLRRNRFVLRRITTTGSKSCIADMEKTFGGIEDIDFDWIINMDEASIYIDMPSNYTYGGGKGGRGGAQTSRNAKWFFL